MKNITSMFLANFGTGLREFKKAAQGYDSEENKDTTFLYTWKINRKNISLNIP